MFPFKTNIMYMADPRMQHPHHPHQQLLSSSPSFSNQHPPPPPPLLMGVGPRLSAASQSTVDGNTDAPIQWPLNPASYQDLANDQVDWAALAQQWIHMKETCTTDQLLAAPPPPIISRPDSQHRQHQPPPSHLHRLQTLQQQPHARHDSNRHDGDEQGEAPMEMDRDDEDVTDDTGGDGNQYPMPVNLLMMPLTQSTQLCRPPPNWLPPTQPLHPQQQQSHAFPVRSADVMIPIDAVSDTPWLQEAQQQAPPPPIISNTWSKKPGWNNWTTAGPQAAPLRPNHIQHQHAQPYAGNIQHSRPQKGVRIHAPAFASKSEDFWQKNKPQTVPLTTPPAHQQHQIIDGSSDAGAFASDPASTLDAAKRKTLPAWIRLGLEKMEREKQRQAEHEDRERQRLISQKEQQQHVAELLDVEAAGKSKFDSDDSSASEPDNDDSGVKANTQSPSGPPSNPLRSRSEQLQQLMMLVRGSLTEILLEVTNEEIRLVASETLSRNRLKARTAQTVKKSALSTLTGGLGLGIYGDSDQSDDDENGSDDEEAQRDLDNDADSDAELQTSIKRSKLAFEARITEIEAELKAAEESEQRWLSEDAPRPSVTTDDDDDTEDKTGIDASNESVATAKTPQSTNSGDNPTRPADKYRWNRRPTAGDSNTVIGEVQPHDQKIVQTHAAAVVHPQHGRPSERKASRFSDPRDTVRNVQLTHGSIVYGLPRGGSASAGMVDKTVTAPSTVATLHHQTSAGKITDSVAPTSTHSETVHISSTVGTVDTAASSAGFGGRADGDASSVASSRSGSKRSNHNRSRKLSRSRSRSRSSMRSAETRHNRRQRSGDRRSKRRSPNASCRRKKGKSSRRSRSRSADRKHSNRHRY